MAREVVIVAGARTPFDKFGGLMKDVPNFELGAMVFAEVMKRAEVPPEDIEEVYLGINMPTQNRSLSVSYTHLRAHETYQYLVIRLQL